MDLRNLRLGISRTMLGEIGRMYCTKDKVARESWNRTMTTVGRPVLIKVFPMGDWQSYHGCLAACTLFILEIITR